MEDSEISHELAAQQEQNLDGLIQAWGSDLLEDWTLRYGDELGMHRTALVVICRVREARAAAHQAQLENAYYGNRAPGIRDEELALYSLERSWLTG